MPLYAFGDFAGLIHRKNLSCAISDDSWTPPNIVPLLNDLAQALEHLHSKEISHSDVKSANALLDRRQDRLHLILSDFSFAFVKGKAKRGVKGFQFSRADGMSLVYAAPELLQVMRNQITPEEFAQAPIHARDSYAFGILTVETILRDNPWKTAQSNEDLIEMVLKGERPNTELIRKLYGMQKWIPVLEIAEQCWQTDPKRRLKFKTIVTQLFASI